MIHDGDGLVSLGSKLRHLKNFLINIVKELNKITLNNFGTSIVFVDKRMKKVLIIPQHVLHAFGGRRN